MTKSFQQCWPRLFHVTHRSSLPSIERHGLLSARRLCALFEVPLSRRGALLDANRDRYEFLHHPERGTAVLRRQLLRDGVMQSRLAPGQTPASWRFLINGMVFFYPDARQAERLRRYDREQEQVVLVCGTGSLVDAGLELLACRYNNGMVDRTPPSRRRLRSPADYVSISQYPGGPVAEVAVRDAITPHIRFDIWAGAT